MLNNTDFGRFFIGNSIFDELSKQITAQSTFPPYNMVMDSEDDYSIEIAVAGYAKDEIDIEVENDIITVTGKAKQSTSDNPFNDSPLYIHQGIAKRKFTRKFGLGEHMEVVGASQDNGILTIKVKKVVPEEKKPKKIAIS